MAEALQGFIENYIRETVAEAGSTTAYRPVVVGSASADDPAWLDLRPG